MDMVGSFDNFLKVFHGLRLVCVILVDMMTSSHLLFFSSVILSISLFPDYMGPSSKGLRKCLLLYALYRPFDSSVIPKTYYVRHSVGMRLPDARRTLSANYCS